MRRNIILLGIMAFLISACNNNEDEMIIDNHPSLTRSEVTYSGDVEGVSVLIFGSNTTNNDYFFQETLNTVWIGNKTSKNLELGKYKFFFYKAEGNEIDILPSSFGPTTKLEDIEFKAKADPDPARNTDYVLPVEEIWLPESAGMANKVYTIVGEDLVQNNLKRAVSQVELYLCRGKEEDGKFTPLPYTGDDNIMKDIQEIRLDISGVGERVNYAGALGNKKTYYSANKETSLSEQGFAFFEGPLVFPSEASVEKADVTVRLIPKAGSILENIELSTTVHRELERNKKLSITIWLTSTYNIITVDVDTSAITSTHKGDEGIWD